MELTTTMDAEFVKRCVREHLDIPAGVDLIFQTDGSLLLVWPHIEAPPEAAGWRFVQA